VASAMKIMRYRWREGGTCTATTCPLMSQPAKALRTVRLRAVRFVLFIRAECLVAIPAFACNHLRRDDQEDMWLSGKVNTGTALCNR
jgi:hypothetical protein